MEIIRDMQLIKPISIANSFAGQLVISKKILKFWYLLNVQDVSVFPLLSRCNVDDII